MPTATTSEMTVFLSPTVAHSTAVPTTASTSGSQSSNNEEVMNNEQEIVYPGIHALSINSIDVLCGRGGHTTDHTGNVLYREMISKHKASYQVAKRIGKRNIAEQLVQQWRNQNPPGRFLERTDPSLGDDSTWRESGDGYAKKKIAQSLRERIPVETQMCTLFSLGSAPTTAVAGTNLVAVADSRKRPTTNAMDLPISQPVTKKPKKSRTSRSTQSPKSIASFVVPPEEEFPKASFLEDYRFWMQTKGLETDAGESEANLWFGGSDQYSAATLDSSDTMSILSSDEVNADDFEWLLVEESDPIPVSY